MYHIMKTIRSENHQLGSYEVNKVPLLCFDDTRYFHANGITSYARLQALYVKEWQKAARHITRFTDFPDCFIKCSTISIKIFQFLVRSMQELNQILKKCHKDIQAKRFLEQDRKEVSKSSKSSKFLF